MNEKILFVDDDINVLRGYKRTYRRRFDIKTAVSGEEGLQKIRETDEPFAVIISDLAMPEMNGIDFLSAAGKISPDSVKIMVTGSADLSPAVEAVNRGIIYRFLTKPCDQKKLIITVEEALKFRQKNQST